MNKEAAKKIDELFFKKSILFFNKLVQAKANSEFALGLFLKLGINFTVIQASEQKIKELEYLDRNYTDRLSFFRNRLTVYISKETLKRKKAIQITIEYKDEEDLNKIYKCLGYKDSGNEYNTDTNLHIIFLCFVYLHEVQHIIKKHLNIYTNSKFINFAKSITDVFNEFELHSIINEAEDYVINHSLEELFEDNHNKEFETNTINEIKKTGLFNDEWKEKELNEFQILKLLLEKKQSEPKKMKVLSECQGNDNGESQQIKVEIEDYNGNKKVIDLTIDPSNNGDSSIEDSMKDEMNMSSLANSLIKHIDNFNKGNKSNLFNKIIEKSKKTNVLWFDKLKTSYFNIVNKKTKKYLTNWSNLNNKTRHLYKAPSKRNIEEQLNLILSIDNSASMSIDSLSKLLYIIEQKINKINKITILIHDTKIVNILEDSKNKKEILDAVKKRHASGGTSHKEIFSYIEENFNKHKNYIYISFSDNHSDIENIYFQYPKLNKINKIWLNSEGRHVKNIIPGVKVVIE